MATRARMVGALLLILVLEATTAWALPPKSRDKEDDLTSDIAKENNPVKKAKLEIRLGELKLNRAFTAYGQGKFDECWKQLDAYLSQMRAAWETLDASGRVASKKPDGFKQLDIALRQSRRLLEDFETRVTFDERQEVERVRKQTEELRNSVLNVLFPAPAPKKPGKESRFAGRIGTTRFGRRAGG